MRRVFRARHCTELASACRLLRSTLPFEGEGSRGITSKRAPGVGLKTRSDGPRESEC